MIFRRLFRAVLGLPGAAYNPGVEVQVLIQLKVGQSVKLTANPRLADGSPASVDGGYDWSADSTAVTVDTIGGPECIITGVLPGSVAVSVTVDADLGEGVREIRSGVAIAVVQAEATSLDISIGAIEDADAFEIKKRPTLEPKG